MLFQNLKIGARDVAVLCLVFSNLLIHNGEFLIALYNKKCRNQVPSQIPSSHPRAGAVVVAEVAA